MGEDEVAGNEIELNNYPNPFNPLTTIYYTLPVDEKVAIKIYDILEREITQLVNEFKTAWTYSFDLMPVAYRAEYTSQTRRRTFFANEKINFG